MLYHSSQNIAISSYVTITNCDFYNLGSQSQARSLAIMAMSYIILLLSLSQRKSLGKSMVVAIRSWKEG